MDIDIGCGGGSAGSSSGGGDKEQGSKGGEGLKRKWSDLEATMKAVKDALIQENAKQSAKIRRLMEDNIRLEETVLRLENPSSFQQGPIRLVSSSNPFLVFSAEVWEMIIEKMNRSSDLKMLCLAFPQLEPLAKEKKKAIFLFEKVLPFVCKHLGGKDINNCRLTCQKWNEDTCAFLANWNAPNLIPDDVTSKTPVPDRDPPYKLIHAYTFYDHRKIQKFLNQHRDHVGNPFFERLLSLYVDDETDLKRFWKSALELVEKFGEHVWNLQMDCDRGSHNQINFYKAVQETLNHVPNLKYLTVKCYFTSLGPSKTKMAAQIGSSPLPPLPYLQSFKLITNGETGMVSAFCSFFSKQIRELELDGKSFGSVNLKDEWLRGLISLEHLKVELTSEEDILRLLKFSSPNLKKLCLHFDVDPRPASFKSEQVCNLLSKFSRLEHLKFGPYSQLEHNSSFGSRIRFTGLKTLEMAVSVEEDDLNQNLDFLFWFPCLKHLVIRKMYTAGTNPTAEKLDNHSTLKIRKYLCTGQMLDSNVWTLVPSLELLEIGDLNQKRYTREMFEKRLG